jgi:hypothetical protein
MHYDKKKDPFFLISLFFCVFIFFTHYTSASPDDYPLLIMKNPNVVIFPSVDKKEVSLFLNSYEEKMNELFEDKGKKYFFIFLGVAVYFFIANILNTWAKKITQQKYYDLLFLEEKEINAIVQGKISISLDDMLLIKNLYENIIKLQKYYYFMLFFAFFPFLHYNLKYILFNKNLLLLNIKKIYESILIK